MVRNSITHPLQIDAVGIDGGGVGMTFCPGKKGRAVRGPPWDRDLTLDIDKIRDWRAGVVWASSCSAWAGRKPARKRNHPNTPPSTKTGQVQAALRGV